MLLVTAENRRDFDWLYWRIELQYITWKTLQSAAGYDRDRLQTFEPPFIQTALS